MQFDFDTLPDRTGTGSLKWEKYAGRDVLPMWVADMDFRSSPAIIEALRARADHGVFAYTKPFAEVEDAALAYLKRAHGYEAKREWLVWLPGIVPALNVLARAFGEPGDAILTGTPVYPPFLSAPGWQGKELITSDLVWDGHRWVFDFDDLEKKVTPRTRTFILCSPHNPLGRVFSPDELMAVAEFCAKHDLVLCSDEIHCDLVFPEASHTVTATLSPEIEERTISMFAPSKTYNLPGLACAYAVIRDPQLRLRFERAARGFITEVNCFGYAGCAAAYTLGEPWRRELIEILRGNRDFLAEFVETRLPGLEMKPAGMEATYLAWLDASEIRQNGIEDPQKFFVEEAGVGLSPGADFGNADYVRLNFGCPRARLAEALERMAGALEKR